MKDALTDLKVTLNRLEEALNILGHNLDKIGGGLPHTIRMAKIALALAVLWVLTMFWLGWCIGGSLQTAL